MVKILHTADWHLGHRLHDLPRTHEHERFLTWLLERIEELEVDALLISGDIFHSANPDADSVARWYRLLAGLGRRFPELEVVAIAGNHDSASRLEAPVPLLHPRHTVIGRTLRGESGEVDLTRHLVPIHGRGGEVEALVLALPFLRPQDLPPDREHHGVEYLRRGTARLYEELIALGRERAAEHPEPRPALIAMGHLHMTAGRLSESSERRVFGGVELLSASMFPGDLAYVALGHLHYAQEVARRDDVRYAGSPIPLSMDEDRYHHQVVVAEVESGSATRVAAVAIPRSVGVLRLPEGGPGLWEEVAAALAGLPARRAEDDPERLPFLEVRVELDEPRPTLRADVERAVQSRAARLVKISVAHRGRRERSGEAPSPRRLVDLTPESLLCRAWRQSYDVDPGEPVLSAFREVVDEVGQARGGA